MNRADMQEAQPAAGADTMDLTKILAQLRQEREQVDKAILILEPLGGSRARRSGRPPGGMSEMTAKGRGRPPGSENKAPRVAGTRGARNLSLNPE
jgi:hypothetical protein